MRRRAGKINVEVTIKVATWEFAKSIASAITVDKLNEILKAAGLEEATMVSAPTVANAGNPKPALSGGLDDPAETKMDANLIAVIVTIPVLVGILSLAYYRARYVERNRRQASSAQVAPLEAMPPDLAGSAPLIIDLPASSGPLNYIERHGVQILVHQIYARWDRNRNWQAWWSAVERDSSQNASDDEQHLQQKSRSLFLNGCYLKILQASSEDCTQWARVFVQMTPGGPLSIDGKAVGFALCAVRPGRATGDGFLRGDGRPDLAGRVPLRNGQEGMWRRAVDTDSDEVFYFHTATLETVSAEIPQEYDYDRDVTFKYRRRWQDYSIEAAVRFSRRVVFIKILPCFARFSQQMGSLIQNEFWGFENGESTDETVTIAFWAESEEQAVGIVRNINASCNQNLKDSDVVINDSRAVHVAEESPGPNGGPVDTVAVSTLSVGADPDVEAQLLGQPVNQPVASAVPSDADHIHPDVQGQDVLQEEVRAQKGAAHMAFSESGPSERESAGATLSLSGHLHVMASAKLVSPELVEEIPSDDSDDIEAGVSYNRQMTVLSRAGHSILTSNQGS